MRYISRSFRAGTAALVILAAISSVAPVAAQEPSASPAASPAASAVPRTFGEAWTPAGCADLGILADFDQIADCGYVTVPENRAAGTADTIQLGVGVAKEAVHQAPPVSGAWRRWP